MRQHEVIQYPRGSVCPWCGVNAHMKRVGNTNYSRRDQRGSDAQEERNWVVNMYECPACGEVNITVSRLATKTRFVDGVPTTPTQEQDTRSVYPASGSMSKVPPEVPEDFANDYREARAILEASPKASAALARRLLQAILRGPGNIPRMDQLHNEIETAIKRGLRSEISEQLHLVRQVGNFAAHPVKDQHTGAILPVEPHEAEHLLDVISLLFDHYFVAPAKAAAVKASLNSKLAAAGKPTLK